MLISVIIPTYNRCELLTRSVSSVLNQTFTDFELIVVDDASTDDTTGTLVKFDDRRIVHLKNEANSKASASRNRGIKASRGSLIALLDDDDEWLPNKLEKQVAKFNASPPNVGLVYSGFEYVTDLDNEAHKVVLPHKKGSVFNDALRGCILGSSTPLIRKECFETAGLFDEAIPDCEDWEMWIRIAKECDFDFVCEVLSRHHIHGDQVSVNLDLKMKAREYLLVKYKNELNQSPDVYGAHIRRIAILHNLKGEYDEGRKLFKKAFLICPYSAVAIVHYFLSFFPNLHNALLAKFGVVNVGGIVLYK
ncbi:glycosyltransferase family 2 protein [Pseudomonadota bacterium]